VIDVDLLHGTFCFVHVCLVCPVPSSNNTGVVLNTLSINILQLRDTIHNTRMAMKTKYLVRGGSYRYGVEGREDWCRSHRSLRRHATWFGQSLEHQFVCRYSLKLSDDILCLFFPLVMCFCSQIATLLGALLVAGASARSSVSFDFG
jgi:hypothetical protein